MHHYNIYTFKTFKCSIDFIQLFEGFHSIMTAHDEVHEAIEVDEIDFNDETSVTNAVA